MAAHPRGWRTRRGSFDLVVDYVRSVMPRPSPSAEIPRNRCIAVLCAADSGDLMDGIRAQFAIDSRIRVVGQLLSLRRLLAHAQSLRPRIVLLDHCTPEADPFVITSRAQRPECRVVILGDCLRDTLVGAAYQCGAWGYFVKSDELDAIVAGIERVARSVMGTFLVSPLRRATRLLDLPRRDESRVPCSP